MKKLIRKSLAVILSLQLSVTSVPWAASLDCNDALKTTPSPGQTGPDVAGVIDFTGRDVKPSTEVRVAHATSSDLIIIDEKSLEKESSVRALRNSKAVIVLRSQEGGVSPRAVLNTPVRSVDVVAALPDDAKGVNLLYESDTGKYESVVKHYAQVSGDLKGIPGVKVISRKTKTDIKTILLLEAGSAKKKDQMLVIIGHNEKGKLKLPDGSDVSVTELTSASERSKRPILILSCGTIDSQTSKTGLVTTRPLFFDEILDAVRHTHETVSGNHATTVAEVVRSLNQGLASKKESKGSGMILALTVIGGSALVATIICSASDDCLGHRPRRLAH